MRPAGRACQYEQLGRARPCEMLGRAHQCELLGGARQWGLLGELVSAARWESLSVRTVEQSSSV